MSSIKQIFQTKITETKDTDVEGVGARRFDENGNEYRWVKNTNGSALTQYQAVCYDVSNNAGASDFFDEVVDPATANLMAFAGIAMSAIADDEFGWIQIGGISFNAATDVPVTTAIDVGDFLLVSNGNEHLGESGSTVAAGTAPTYPYGAVAIEAIATASTGSTGSTGVNIIGMK